MEFTPMFPIYLNVFDFTQIWTKLSSFAQIYHTQMLLIYPNVSNFTQNLNNVFQLAQIWWRLLEFQNDFS